MMHLILNKLQMFTVEAFDLYVLFSDCVEFIKRFYTASLAKSGKES